MNLNNNNNRKRRKRFNKSNYELPYTLRKTPVCLGPGLTTSRVTLNYYYQNHELGYARINLMQDFVNNVEFERNLSIFRFFRIKLIQIIIFPRAGNSLDYGKVVLDWNSDLSENILLDDSAKVFGAYNYKMEVFRFLPPNSMLQAVNGLIVNYKQWTPTDLPLQSTTPPGYLKFNANFDFKFSVEVITEFKGNQTNINNGDNKYLGNRLVNGEIIINDIKQVIKKDN